MAAVAAVLCWARVGAGRPPIQADKGLTLSLFNNTALAGPPSDVKLITGEGQGGQHFFTTSRVIDPRGTDGRVTVATIILRSDHIHTTTPLGRPPARAHARAPYLGTRPEL